MFTSEFPVFYVTADVIVLSVIDEELHALVIKRGDAPFKGKWALPGGFVGATEDLRAAAERELVEETGVRVRDLIQVGAYGAPHRDPRYDRVVTVAWLAALREAIDPEAGTDASHAEWRSVDWLLAGRHLAFDHKQILSDAVDRARALLEDPPADQPLLAASLVADEFTLLDLRNAYAAVLGRELDPGNFHRKVKSIGLVEPTGRTHATGRGRPAELFTFAAR